MQTDSPQYTERPVQFIEVLFVNGMADSLTLEDDETYTISGGSIRVQMRREVVEYTREHVALFRVRSGTVRTPLAKPVIIQATDPGTIPASPS